MSDDGIKRVTLSLPSPVLEWLESHGTDIDELIESMIGHATALGLTDRLKRDTKISVTLPSGECESLRDSSGLELSAAVYNVVLYHYLSAKASAIEDRFAGRTERLRDEL